MQIFLSSGGGGRAAGFGSGGPGGTRGCVADAFGTVLGRFGPVRPCASAAEGVRRARRSGGVHICVALPHELPADAGAETLPLFAMNVAECPQDDIHDGAGAGWQARLGRSGAAICLSSHGAAAVRRLMGDRVRVAAIPPPLACFVRPHGVGVLTVSGGVLDSAAWADTRPLEPPAPPDEDAPPPPPPPEAAPAWRRTPRFRVGTIRLHMMLAYREAVADLLPVPARRLISAAYRTLRRAAGQMARALARLRAGQNPAPIEGWCLAAAKVRLDGLVFAAVQGGNDAGWSDLLSAFVCAFRQDPAATLVVATAGLEPEGRAGLAGMLRRMGPFACRVVILDGEVAGGLDSLIAASLFYVCAMPGEAATLPILRFLAAGRPAVAPACGALADVIAPATSFVVASGLDYVTHPGDRAGRLAAQGWRLEWESLCGGLTRAAALGRAPAAYAAQAAALVGDMAAYCGPDHVAALLEPMLAPRVSGAWARAS